MFIQIHLALRMQRTILVYSIRDAKTFCTLYAGPASSLKWISLLFFLAIFTPIHTWHSGCNGPDQIILSGMLRSPANLYAGSCKFPQDFQGAPWDSLGPSILPERPSHFRKQNKRETACLKTALKASISQTLRKTSCGDFQGAAFKGTERLSFLFGGGLKMTLRTILGVLEASGGSGAGYELVCHFVRQRQKF